MRVLLIDGAFSQKRYVEPLGISYLAAVLRAKEDPDLECIIYEPGINGDSLFTAVMNAADYDAEVIGLSFITAMDDVCKKFISEYKKTGRNTLFIVGGHGPSLTPESFLNAGADIIFIGEGEISFPIVIEALKNGDSLENKPGIAYKKDGKMVMTPPPDRVENLDHLPFMARDVLKELSVKYDGEISARMMSSRGCYMNCEYCSIQAYTNLQGGKRYRERSVESLLREMDYLHQKYNVNQFLFEDDNFIPLDKSKAKVKIDLFCEGVKEINIPNIKLHLQCRPDNFDPILIRKLCECGLVDLFMGVETINQFDMEFFGRKSDAAYNIYVMEELEKLGFSCDVNAKIRMRIGYIMFHPESTRESLRRSGEFLLRFHVTPKKLVNLLRPYPYTKVREKFLRLNYLSEDGAILFNDTEIKDIYDATDHIVRNILSFREMVRLPSKLNEELSLNFGKNEALLELDNIRKQCDKLCYEAFFELLDSTDILGVVNKYDVIVDEIKSNDDIQKKLLLLKKSMNITTMEYGIYR